jgi:DNA-binding transcriptional regulator YiaG
MQSELPLTPTKKKPKLARRKKPDTLMSLTSGAMRKARDSNPIPAYKTEHERWLFANPIRKWRLERGLAQPAGALALQCSVAALRLWEQGSIPGRYAMLTIAQQMHRDPAELREEIAEWLRSRPTPRA